MTDQNDAQPEFDAEDMAFIAACAKAPKHRACADPSHKLMRDCRMAMASKKYDPATPLESFPCLFARFKVAIIRLRRGKMAMHTGRKDQYDSPAAWKAFRADVEQNIDAITTTLDSRWIVSILDSYADFADDADANLALAIVGMVTWDRIHAAANGVQGDRNAFAPLWDGLTVIGTVKETDAHRNLFRRLGRALKRSPVLSALYRTLYTRACQSPHFALSRLDEIHALNIREQCGAQIRSPINEKPSVLSKREINLIEHYDSKKSYYSTGGRNDMKLAMDALGVSIPIGAVVLDIGCGDGRTMKWLSEDGCDVYGFDYSPVRAEAAQKAVPSATVTCSDAITFLSNDTRQYDVIFALEVLEHVESPDKIIELAKARLKPGGIVVGTVPINLPAKQHLHVYKSVHDAAVMLKSDQSAVLQLQRRHGALLWRSPCLQAKDADLSIPDLPVFTYWEGKRPAWIDRCLATIRTHHPDAMILDPDAVRDLKLPGLDGVDMAKLLPCQRADIIRLAMLADRGGVWLDADFVLLRPLDWFREQVQSRVEFVGYCAPLNRHMHNNGLMAARPGAWVISRMLQMARERVANLKPGEKLYRPAIGPRLLNAVVAHARRDGHSLMTVPATLIQPVPMNGKGYAKLRAVGNDDHHEKAVVKGAWSYHLGCRFDPRWAKPGSRTFADWLMRMGCDSSYADRTHPIHLEQRQVALHDAKHDQHRGVWDGVTVIQHESNIGRIVDRVRPSTILDYGCGSSPRVTKASVERKWNAVVTSFDPAVPRYMKTPKGRYDMVVCTDVLEHVPHEAVPSVASRVVAHAEKAVYISVSTRKASDESLLPNGENAHATIRPESWWLVTMLEAVAQAASKRKLDCWLAIDGPDKLYRWDTVAWRPSLAG